MYKIIDTEFIEVRNKTSMIRVVILCDTSAEIPEPESSWDIGSICWVANEHKVLVLNNAGEWA